MKILRIATVLLIVCGAAVCYAPAYASVSASLNRHQIASGENVILSLQHQGRTSGQPDLSPLKRDFEIVGTSSGTRLQIVNGQATSSSQINISLIPKHDGNVQVPPLTWDGESSAALALTVDSNNGAGTAAASAGTGTGTGTGTGATASKSATSTNSKHVFFNIKTDAGQSYVNGATLVTLRLYTDQQLSQATLEFPSNNDIKVQQLGEDKQSTEVREGTEFQVVQRSYILLPQRSGTLNIAGPVLNAQVLDTDSDDATDPFFGNGFPRMPLARMMNATKPLRVQGKTISLEVRARPNEVEVKDWLPIQSLSVKEEWRPSSNIVHVGDPLTRHLHVHAIGTIAAQLPDLSSMMSVPDGMKIYPDQAKLDTQANDGKLQADSDQDIALIASQPGHYTLPAMHVTWWDTNQNKAQVINLPARTIEVLAAVGNNNASANGTSSGTSNGTFSDTPSSKQAPTAAAIKIGGTQAPFQTSTANPWCWISLGLFIVWLATLAGWWQTQRSNKAKLASITPSKLDKVNKPVSAGAALQAFQQAAQKNNAPAAHQYLLAWGKAKWPQDPPSGLRAIGKRLQNASLSNLLQELDRACYTDKPWQGAALVEALKANVAAVKKTKTRTEIAGLYPES